MLITVRWRKARRADRPGLVSLKLMDAERRTAAVSMGLDSTREEMMTVNKVRIEAALKLAYLIVERWTKEERNFSIFDVAEEFERQYSKPDAEYASRLSADVKFDKNIATFGRGFMVDDSEEILIAPHVKMNLLEYFEYLAEKFRREDKVSTSRNIRSTGVRLALFIGDRTVSLADIDAKFIAEFNSYLADTDLSDSTASFYMRTLKLVLFQARSEGLINVGDDWFNGVNIHIDKAGQKTISKALPIEAIKRLAEFDFENDTKLELARDVFMFCFYMNGMEWNDVVLLQPINIDPSGYIVFNRRQRGVEMRIPIGAKARAIIDKYFSPENTYLFPMVKDGTPKDVIRARSSSFRHIKAAGKAAGIGDLTFSRARATWLSLTQRINIAEQLI